MKEGYFMNDDYFENEIKVLDVSPEIICNKLDSMGAKKVFDDDRVFTTFDSQTESYLAKDILIRLTEEEKLKLSISTDTSKSSTGEKRTIKVFVSRKKEMIDFFAVLGIEAVAEVKSHRISYELTTSKGIVDFDLDTFPLIGSFLEIDLENMDRPLDEYLKELGLENNRIVNCGTEQIYGMYGYDYYKEFSIKK